MPISFSSGADVHGVRPAARGRGRTALGLFVLVLALGAWRLDAIGNHVSDEEMHVRSAFVYAEHGQVWPDNWYHPPLKHLATRASIALVGDNPWGWRLRNVMAGAGAVALLFLLGAELLGSQAVGATAALLLAFDPLVLVFLRSSFEDVPAVAFGLLGLFLSLRHHRRGGSGTLIAAGVAFGLAISFRTYMVVLLAGVGVALAAGAVRGRRWATLVDLATAFGVVPFPVYLAAWLPWFRRGYGFGEWLSFQGHSLAAATRVDAFDPIVFKLAGAGRWFTGQVGIWFPTGAGGVAGGLAVANDPPVWLLVLPAMALAAVAVWRERRWEPAAAPAAFAALYVPFLLAPRPIFLYSAVAVLPAAFLTVAWAAHRVLGRRAWVLAVAAVAWGAFLYPLAVGAPVRTPMHRAILERLERVAP